MSKFGKITSDPPIEGDRPDPKKGEGGWFKKNQHSVVIAAILILAFALRFVFAYGVSSSSVFALSGGSGASEHLHTITDILTSGFVLGADPDLFFPFGSASSNPPLLDIVLALFAFIPKAMGMSAVDSAGAVLCWSAVIFGTLACLPMYCLGKQMLGSDRAGYLAAIFLAFCPVVISQTVFSNGTDIAFIAFMFILLVCFMYRGVSKMENGESAKKDSILCSVIMAVIALSYADIRPIIVLMLICMAAALLIARFRSKDLMPIAAFYSLPILSGALFGTIYFACSGLIMGYLGVILAAVFGVLVCMLFAVTQKVPWTLTLPAIIIGVIVVLVVLSFAAPDIYGALVNGTGFEAEGYGDLVSSSLSISAIATNFGFVTMWFGVAMIVVRLFKIGKNISSATYVFILMWMIVGTLYGMSSTTNAVIFAPVFAVGFAAVMEWLAKAANLKAYAASFKGQDFKSIWKKILKPIPFVTVLCVALIVAVPNVTYALDAASPSNTNGHTFNPGAIGYYVKTDSDWLINDAFSSYNGEDKDGALVTWMDYSADAASFGGFEVTTDTRGNGSTAASNILLSNAIDGSSMAAMTVYLVKYNGVDASRSALTTVMTESQFLDFKDRFDDVCKYRELILEDISEYGILRTDISDENVVYISAAKYLTDTFTNLEITQMFEAMEIGASKDISYIMVSGNMFPLYYGYSSTFATMAYLNGYALSDAYGTVAQFLKTDYYTQYLTGTYAYTDDMYNTLLWRTYIGMSPAEAGLTGTYACHEYIQSLILSDGTYKAMPGYGLANFEVDYDHCYVKYNPDADATTSSDGWIKMLYEEAIKEQQKNGGLINYLSGYPVFLKYAYSSTGARVAGNVYTTVGDLMVPVESIRVTVVDGNGMLRYVDFTNSDGYYSVVVADEDSQIIFASGSEDTTGGTIIKTVDYNEQTTIDVEVTTASVSGSIDAGDVDLTLGTEFMVRFTPKTSYSEPFSTTTSDLEFYAEDLIPDTYTIAIMDLAGKTTYSTKSFSIAPGENNGISMALDSAKVTVTVKDGAGVVMRGMEVIMTSSDGTMFVSDPTSSDGVVDIHVVPGTYMFSMATDGYTTSTSSVTVEKDKDTTASVTALEADVIESASVTSGVISAIGFQGAFTDGEIKVPAGTIGTAVYGVYSASEMDNEAFVVFDSTADSTFSPVMGYILKGKLMSSSNAVSGKVAFIDQADCTKMVLVNATTEGYKVVLPAGDYNVYAVSGNNVLFSTVKVNAEETTADFELVGGSTKSGSAHWYSSSYDFQYMPIIVKVTVKEVDYYLNVITNSDGDFSVVIPDDAKVEAVAELVEGDVYYFEETNGAKVYEKTMDAIESFTAKVEDIKITNANNFPITVICGDKEEKLAANASAEFPIKSTSMTVRADKADGVYYNKSMPIEPAKEYAIDITYDVTLYTKVELTVEDGAIVTITPQDDGSYETITSNKAYYFENGDLYDLKVTNADGNKVGYKTIDLTETTVAITMQDAVRVKGYVGVALSGTIEFNGLSFNVTNGSYNVLVPTASSYEIKATVSGTDTEYTAELTAASFSSTEDNVFNMSVTGGTVVLDDETEAKAELTLTKMGDISESKRIVDLEFTAEITAPGDAPTYLIEGGSAWRTVQFYSDEDRKQQITQVNGTTTVYGKGTIVASAVAECDSNLSVVVKDINGNSVCTGVFEHSEVWKKTSNPDATKVSYGTDGADFADYLYGVKITNDDNFTKDFALSLYGGVDTDKWYVAYVDGTEIVDSNLEFSVDGYSSKTVYVKITTKDGTETDIPKITVDVTSEYTLTADEEGITVSSNKATLIMEKQDVDASVEYSVSGRGVVTDRGQMPVYEYVLIALVVLLIILLVWLGIRRGVFTRKN